MANLMSSGKGQAGFTYVGALLLIAVVGAGLAAVGEAWSHARQREKEAELLWIGNQFKQAIGLYYQRSPGAVKRYPENLEDLIEDKRFLNVQRYLRRIYSDPMTGKSDWAPIPAPGGGIMGVRSQSGARAIRPFDLGDTYSEWRFVYEPTVTPSSTSAKRQ